MGTHTETSLHHTNLAVHEGPRVLVTAGFPAWMWTVSGMDSCSWVCEASLGATACTPTGFLHPSV